MSKTVSGNFFEDFRIGQTIRHAVPRTITTGDAALYTALYGTRFAVQSSDAFAKTLGAAVSHEFCGTLDVAVARAAADASRSEAREPVVLLSPACASYDQFPNYEVRGDRFRTLVKSVTTHSGAAA